MLRKRVGFFHLILWRGCTYKAVSPGSRGTWFTGYLISHHNGDKAEGNIFKVFMRGILDKVLLFDVFQHTSQHFM